jgi:hypothetical protein
MESDALPQVCLLILFLIFTFYFGSEHFLEYIQIVDGLKDLLVSSGVGFVLTRFVTQQEALVAELAAERQAAGLLRNEVQSAFLFV